MKTKFVFKTNYRLMLVRSIAILSTFIKLSFAIMIMTFLCLFLSDRLRQVLLHLPCRCLVIFANSLDRDQARHLDRPDLDPN